MWKKINKDFRGVDKETDVLSSPLKIWRIILGELFPFFGLLIWNSSWQDYWV